jgi:hypothetical protein
MYRALRSHRGYQLLGLSNLITQPITNSRCSTNFLISQGCSWFSTTTKAQTPTAGDSRRRGGIQSRKGGRFQTVSNAITTSCELEGLQRAQLGTCGKHRWTQSNWRLSHETTW